MRLMTRVITVGFASTMALAAGAANAGEAAAVIIGRI